MYKLLLADDSVTIQRVIELTFSGEDIQIISVDDGEQAIARIPSERPDIVLADIGMPKRSGYDVAAFVKGQPGLAHIPVLLLAGAFERVDKARAEQVRCDGVLVKPFEPRQVVSRVRELLEDAKSRSAQAAYDVSRQSNAPSESPVVSKPPAPAFLDSSLDDYFEKLNAAFEDVLKPSPTQGGHEPSAETSTPGSDSLDGYFDRLSAAFADLARPLRGSGPMPAAVDDGLSDEPIPTVEELTKENDEVQPLGGTTSLGGRSLDPPVYPPSSLSMTLAPTSRVTPETTPHPPAGEIEARSGAPEEDIGGVADALSALLNEQGAHGQQGRRPSAGAGISLDPMTRDALVDAVTRRVLDRLVPEVIARLKRLVAEELARLEPR